MVTTISINEFKGYDEEQILEFLKLGSSNSFEIIISRMVLVSATMNEFVAQDYTSAAYSGELLAGIADHFSYMVVEPRAAVPFIFVVTVDKLAKLAHVLFRMVQRLDEEDDKWEEFQFAACEFHYRATECGRRIRCQPLWDIAGQIMEK